ncbi:hypothetical protein ACLOJK_038885 [Asimina triloba]
MVEPITTYPFVGVALFVAQNFLSGFLKVSMDCFIYLPVLNVVMCKELFPEMLEMQEFQMMAPEDVKPRKKKVLAQVSPQDDIKVGDLLRSKKKRKALMKRNMRNEASPSIQQVDRPTPDSFPDSAGLGSEYRALRRKYLLLEEESSMLVKELTEAEAEVKNLEDEKFALLDQLVVLEGLVDPSELQSHGGP